MEKDVSIMEALLTNYTITGEQNELLLENVQLTLGSLLTTV